MTVSYTHLDVYKRQLGGPIAWLADGDTVTFDVTKRRLDTNANLAARMRETPRAGRDRPPTARPSVVMAKYAALVSSASKGAITHPPPRTEATQQQQQQQKRET